jgi:predicted nucleic acid-binding protein
MDASALVEYLLHATRAQRVARLIESGADLHVPVLCDVEVTAAVRRAVLIGATTGERAAQAVDDYLDLPITRHGHTQLLQRTLTLRANFSAYDAIYVTLAEHLAAPFLPADEALARAVRRHTTIDLA